MAENGEILNNINQDMDDILKEINFNKFDNSLNSKIKEKLNKSLQRKLRMDKLVQKNSDYDYDKNTNNILIDNLDSCINDHKIIFKKIESDVNDNNEYMKKIKNILQLFDKISEPYEMDKKGKILYFF